MGLHGVLVSVQIRLRRGSTLALPPRELRQGKPGRPAHPWLHPRRAGGRPLSTCELELVVDSDEGQERAKSLLLRSKGEQIADPRSAVDLVGRVQFSREPRPLHEDQGRLNHQNRLPYVLPDLLFLRRMRPGTLNALGRARRSSSYHPGRGNSAMRDGRSTAHHKSPLLRQPEIRAAMPRSGLDGRGEVGQLR